MKRLSVLGLLAILSGCATTGATSTMTPEVQTKWQSCEAAINTRCHDRAHGDPAHESACRRDARREFSNLNDDASRDQFLRDRGCAL